MRNEPKVNRKNLKNHISEKYGIEVMKFTFVPIGEFAYSYVLKANDEKEYFLKMYESNRLTDSKLHSLDFSLSIAYQLNQDREISQVIYPIKTEKGLLKTKYDNLAIVIWSFIDGDIVSEKQSRTKDFMIELGGLLARIHQATNSLNLNEEKTLVFEIGFKNDLLTSLKEATECVTSTDKNHNKLQKMIKPQMDNILQSLIYLEELAERLKKEDKLDLVVCHTDPIRHNILVNENGMIYLVDWDGAILAPFEQDIWFYLNENYLEDFIISYKQIRKIDKINEDFIAFLFYKRTLEDLTDWIYRIFFEEMTQEQIKSDFEGLEEDSLPVLPNMKEIEEKLRKNARKWVEI
ncbi:MAG: phosphotransferase [Candidatus Heimdallarchaeota archaeon]|nr:phosphotransferase [Candidatus Heimdallarchaeota archaeon]MCK4770101.1 phosphotransferase [Candidatus Heimdallarchaeota archaeon]